MSVNDDLIFDLRKAERRKREAIEALAAARAAHREAVKLVESILAEIEAGTTGRPLLDATGTLARASGADDGEPPLGRNYDRVMTAAVEAAEARRAEATVGDLAVRRAGKVVSRAKIEAPVNYDQVETDEVRTCNRCNAIRPPAVGVCPACGSPEFRIERRAGRPDRAPPSAKVRPYDLATVREAIDEVEGPAGDGSRTRICSKCRQGYDADAGSCPACGSLISRPASECLANLSAPGPVKVATGGHGDDRYCFVIHGQPWDADAIRSAVAIVEGTDGDGTRSAVCSECATCYPKAAPKCPRCGGRIRRTTIRTMEDVGAEPPASRESLAEASRTDDAPAPDGHASGAARRKRARSKKGVAS